MAEWLSIQTPVIRVFMYLVILVKHLISEQIQIPVIQVFVLFVHSPRCTQVMIQTLIIRVFIHGEAVRESVVKRFKYS